MLAKAARTSAMSAVAGGGPGVIVGGDGAEVGVVLQSEQEHLGDLLPGGEAGAHGVGVVGDAALVDDDGVATTDDLDDVGADDEQRHGNHHPAHAHLHDHGVLRKGEGLGEHQDGAGQKADAHEEIRAQQNDVCGDGEPLSGGVFLGHSPSPFPACISTRVRTPIPRVKSYPNHDVGPALHRQI